MGAAEGTGEAFLFLFFLFPQHQSFLNLIKHPSAKNKKAKKNTHASIINKKD